MTHIATNGTAVLDPAEIVQRVKDAYRNNNWLQAEALCRQLLTQQPDSFDALNVLGMITAQTGRTEEAAALLVRAVAIEPDRLEALGNLGNVLHDLKRYDEALAQFDRLLRLRPDDAQTLCNRGVVLGDMNRHQAALESYDQALGIDPDSDQALINRGVALRALGRHADGLESFERALVLKPESVEALINRGSALDDLQRYGEAQQCYERALQIRPDSAGAHWNLSMYLLRQGDFGRGWKEHEWRWQGTHLAGFKRDFQPPLWLGDASLEGKTILLHSEQGLGDTMHFCRYAKAVAALGATVVLEAPAPLLPLLKDVAGVSRLVPTGTPLPDFDLHCPLLSLPLAFHTDADSIPADVPYLFSDPDRVALWKARLGRKTKPRVGLVWSGSPTQKNDRNRSMSLAQLLPLFDDTVEWISLQKDVRDEDARLLASRTDIRDFGARINDFSDTAALIQEMDLVISVCTSVAHLAGAMGKPVWILLCANPCWRWLIDREDSPWYPTARLFRQPALGDWGNVIKRVRDALEVAQPALIAGDITGTLCHSHTGIAAISPNDLNRPEPTELRKYLIYILIFGFAAAVIWLVTSRL